jgi:hypothetical protein
MRVLGKLPFLKKYAPTLVRDLAGSMIHFAMKYNEEVKVVESLEI